ncbi:MAG: glycosyl hydrolase [Polyangiaceae bacterium]
MRRVALGLVLLLALPGCWHGAGTVAPGALSEAASAPEPSVAPTVAEPPASDSTADATNARTELERELRHLASLPAFALGQEDATAYGVGWSNEPDRSDVKSVCGAHPAVHGWDVFGIELGAAKNGDGVAFEHMRRLIQAAHRRGGINTISWHAANPVTGGNTWDTTRAVRAVLPGGALHAQYRGWLARVADYLDTLRDERGAPIPIVFRPYHEHTGSWFWWGRAHTDDDGFVRLWRFTIDFLRAERGLGQLLFAFSPAGGDIYADADYLFRYPGDGYVDVFGVDYYYQAGGKRMTRLAEITVRQARRHDKIPAITELGAQDGLSRVRSGARWIEQSFLAPLSQSDTALGIAYALLWRNAHTGHFFVPYPGHPGAAALARFCADRRVLLEDDVAARRSRLP